MKKSIFGMLLVMESLFLGSISLVALYYHYTQGDQDWKAFAITTAITFVCGAVLTAYGHTDIGRTEKQLSRGGAFIVVGLTWVVFSIFGMLPFILYEGLDVDVASAYFETMSGFSTMGATIIPDIEAMPHGILMWRSMMQWMGGLGIVVFSFAMLPVKDMKNSTMFIAEMSGLTIHRLQPKIGATSRRLLLIYLVLTIICAIMFWVGPMDLFDAVCFSFSTIATGGYGTHTASIGYFQSSYIEYVCATFMLISSLNFGIYYYISIRRGRECLKNEEVKAFLLTVTGLVAVFCLIPNDGVFNLSLFFVLYTGLLPVSLLAYDERAHWEKLAPMLPVTLRDIVRSKYVLGFFLTLAAGGLLFLGRAFTGRASFSEAASAALGAAALGLVFQAVLYPFLFRLGVEKGRLVMGGIVAVMVFAGLQVRLLPSGAPSVGNDLPLTGNEPILFAAAVVLMLVSIRISEKQYEKRAR